MRQILPKMSFTRISAYSDVSYEWVKSKDLKTVFGKNGVKGLRLRAQFLGQGHTGSVSGQMAKDMDAIIAEVAGADVLPLVKALKNKRNVSEFKIAEQLKLEINIVRNMLYRLLHANLVSFIRRKDKKKGWYIYYWTFNIPRIKDLMLDLKKRRMEMLKERLEREKANHFFACPDRCIRLDFEQATDFGYKCPECGQLLNQEDNKKIIDDIESELADLKKQKNK